MQAIGQPNVEVEASGSIGQLAQGRLAQWHGMLAKRVVEDLVQHHSVFPKRALAIIARGLVEAQPGSYKTALDPAVGSIALPGEAKVAARDPRSLLLQCFACFPAPRQPHTAEPVPHTAAQLDFATAGANCLSLQVEQDHPGACPIGHAQEAWFLAAAAAPARLNHKGDAMPALLPGLIVGQPPMRQSGKAEACVGNPDAAFVIAKNLGGNIDQRLLLWLDH